MAVVVVGGGVVGLCTSLALARRGMHVTVIDAGTPGSGASAANAGWIVPFLSGPVPAPGLLGTSLRWLLQPNSPLWIRPRLEPAFGRWLFGFWRHMNRSAYEAGLEATLDLSRETMRLFDSLVDSGLSFEMHDDGVVMAYTSLKAYHAGLRETSALAAFGYAPMDDATGDAVRDIDPSLGADIKGAFRLDGQRHVDPISFTAAVRRELERLAVTIVADAPVTGFSVRRQRVDAVETGTSSVASDAVVIAAGVATGKLAGSLGVRVPIEAGKGYAVDVAPVPLPIRRPVYLHEERVAVTPLSDRLRMAGTMELGGRGDSISASRVRAIEASARRLLIGWSDAPVSTSYLSGLRPLTPDGLPVIGPLPGVENVWIASGHAMLGLTLAPATAEIVAAGIVSGAIPAVIKPFLPDRFVGRRPPSDRRPATLRR